MDDLVKQAMAKWPNVAACYGWLGLDARGHWYMRDDRVQALGPFVAGPEVSETQRRAQKGARLTHDKLLAFVARNYAADGAGQWYFQNGPQRVYVELEATPWVARVPASDEAPVLSHTGIPLEVQQVWLDDSGQLVLQTAQGPALVHTADMWQAAQRVQSGQWQVKPLPSTDWERYFGYKKSPWAQRAAKG
jgi:hypothetical protein